MRKATQSRENDIWSDFENLLGCPDFNTLEEIFDGYAPDYLSERESDRDSIIYQVELNGNLKNALYEFADKADDSLCNIQANDLLEQILDSDGIILLSTIRILWKKFMIYHGNRFYIFMVK